MRPRAGRSAGKPGCRDGRTSVAGCAGVLSATVVRQSGSRAQEPRGGGVGRRSSGAQTAPRRPEGAVRVSAPSHGGLVRARLCGRWSAGLARTGATAAVIGTASCGKSSAARQPGPRVSLRSLVGRSCAHGGDRRDDRNRVVRARAGRDGRFAPWRCGGRPGFARPGAAPRRRSSRRVARCGPLVRSLVTRCSHCTGIDLRPRDRRGARHNFALQRRARADLRRACASSAARSSDVTIGTAEARPLPASAYATP